LHRLRTILLCSWIYIAILLISLVYAFVMTILIRYNSVYIVEKTCLIATIDNYNIDGDKLSLDLFAEERIVATYYFIQRLKD